MSRAQRLKEFNLIVMDDLSTDQLFAANIRFLRHRNRYTQKEMAALLKVGRGAYEAWENLRGSPSPDKLMDVAKTLGVTAHDLLTENLTAILKDERTEIYYRSK